MPSSRNSGRRFSTPTRGRRSFASTGRCFPIASRASQTAAKAPYCLRLLASELSLTKAAPINACSSESCSLLNASPSLCNANDMLLSPRAAYRSPSWLMPMAVLRRNAGGFMRHQYALFTCLRHFGPEHAIENVGVGFNQHPRLIHFVFLDFQDPAQGVHLPAHMFQHLMDGV